MNRVVDRPDSVASAEVPTISANDRLIESPSFTRRGVTENVSTRTCALPVAPMSASARGSPFLISVRKACRTMPAVPRILHRPLVLYPWRDALDHPIRMILGDVVEVIGDRPTHASRSDLPSGHPESPTSVDGSAMTASSLNDHGRSRPAAFAGESPHVFVLRDAPTLSSPRSSARNRASENAGSRTRRSRTS